MVSEPGLILLKAFFSAARERLFGWSFRAAVVARKANDELPFEVITISIPTLADRRFWEQLT